MALLSESDPDWAPYDDDKPREECGLFAVFEADEAAVLVTLGLMALQHRGEEGCGIASFDGERFHTERHLGLVAERFNSESTRDRLKGRTALGHTRYATQGATVLRNVQPLFFELEGGFAIAHNGNLTNSRLLREELTERGALFQTTSDTEVIPQLMAQSRAGGLVDRFIDALRQVLGGYAVIALTAEGILAARDPLGLRPLVLGELPDGAPVLASETCALDALGARFVRSVANGEVLVISKGEGGRANIRSIRAFPEMPERPCVFEYIYFARPNSVMGGRSIYDIRRRFGERLARERPAAADIVVPVLDSGLPAALGFAAASSLPLEMGIVRSPYVQRTFIAPHQEIRQLKVRMKHSANRMVLAGKRVVIVDDSIVRGTTSRQIVQMVREAGAREVHFRVASPMLRFPDFYGIDMPTAEAFIAHNRTEAEVGRELGADSIGFLSIDGLYWGLGERERRSDYPQFSDHCFTGDYPIPLPDRDADRAGKEYQLSLLSDLP